MFRWGKRKNISTTYFIRMSHLAVRHKFRTWTFRFNKRKESEPFILYTYGINFNKFSLKIVRSFDSNKNYTGRYKKINITCFMDYSANYIWRKCLDEGSAQFLCDCIVLQGPILRFLYKCRFHNLEYLKDVLLIDLLPKYVKNTRM